MSLPVDERLLNAQYYLIEQRKAVIARKKQLYEQFRAFALNKLKTHGRPFKVKFRAIDGDPGLKYKEVDMGDEFCLVYGSFDFDPKTNLITNYVRTEFIDTKLTEDINELMEMSTNKPHVFRKIKQTLEHATELEKIRIDKMMRHKIDKILMGIFKGELSFEDPEFKKLVNINIALEQELTEINTRIQALDIINRSSGVQINSDAAENVVQQDKTPRFSEDVQFTESKTEDRHAAIIDFLKGNFVPGIDPSLAVVALGQQGNGKTM